MTPVENQIKAITHQLGPCMVLAGPGSGKTFTIIHRIEYLIKNGLAHPDQILVVTFTREAARQMRDRFVELMQESRDERDPYSCGITFGTFHSVFYAILKESGRFQASVILTDKEKKRMISSLIPGEVGRRFDTRDEYEEYLMCIISEIERERTCAETESDSFMPRIDAALFRNLSEGYKREKKRSGKIDFTDILLECRDLLKSDPVLLEKWRARFRFFLVDEFQDINAVQYDILKMLAFPANNLFVVGDDDQAIYSFRGSSPVLLMRFSEMFQNSRTVFLDTNFRSCKKIVAHSGKLISHNRKRLKKKSRSFSKDDGDPAYYRFGTRNDQYEWIAGYLEKDNPYGTAAIVTRTHRQLDRIASVLEDRCLNFSLRKPKVQRKSHFVIDDLKAYAHLIISAGEKPNRRDLLHVLRILDIPVPRDLLDEQRIDSERLVTELKDQSWLLEPVKQLFANIERLSEMPPYVGLRYIVGKMGYSTYAVKSACEKQSDPEMTERILNKVIVKAKEAGSWEQWLYETNDMDVGIVNNHQGDHEIMLMTMHASKGLEFDTVIIPDLVEGLTPPNRKQKEMEEERRLVYVAMTRAKKNLILTSFRKSGYKGMAESRFIKETGITLKH